MTWATWLAVAGICTLGAMSPGPSLAVVLRHTMTGGRRQGVAAALAHGAMIGIYALACISGVAFVVQSSAEVFIAMQWLGAAYLVWLGIKGLRAQPHPESGLPQATTTASAIRDGSAVAFLNPKIAVFFIALFSQVIGPDTSLAARLGYAATAAAIDGIWYVLVAWLFSNPRWLARLQARAIWFERLFGVILILLALRLVWQSVQGA